MVSFLFVRAFILSSKKKGRHKKCWLFIISFVYRTVFLRNWNIKYMSVFYDVSKVMLETVNKIFSVFRKKGSILKLSAY